ncbi:hypothetical protein Landi51_06702 [Colletotrichum acutatum]
MKGPGRGKASDTTRTPSRRLVCPFLLWAGYPQSGATLPDSSTSAPGAARTVPRAPHFDVRTLNTAASEVRAGTSDCGWRRRTRWEPQVVAKNGSTAADKCRGAASSLAAGVITRTIPNSSRITSESSGEVHLEAIIGYRAAHHQLPLVTGLRLSPESYQDGFHDSNTRGPMTTRRFRLPIAKSVLRFTNSRLPVGDVVPFFTEHDGSPIIEDTRKSPSLSTKSSPSPSSDKPSATSKEDEAQPKKSKTEFNSIPCEILHMSLGLTSGPDAGTQAHRKSSTEFKEVVATEGKWIFRRADNQSSMEEAIDPLDFDLQEPANTPSEGRRDEERRTTGQLWRKPESQDSALLWKSNSR